MASPPPNPDTRDLPYGWIQQYNYEYRQWFYINAREQPPRSSWEHPLGPPGFAPPPGPPPPDRSYSRSPYGAPPPAPAPPGHGGYPGYQPPPQNYYNNPQGGYAGGPPYSSGPERVVYVDEQQRTQQKKSGPGIGTAVMAGGAGLVGGAFLMNAFEDHDRDEREQGFEDGYGQGYDQGDDGGGFF